MNEKINELAIRAGTEIYKIDAGYGIVTRTALYDGNIEKFAELIVQECIDTLQRGRDNFGSNDPQILKGARDALTIAVYDIQNRFEMREDSKS